MSAPPLASFYIEAPDIPVGMTIAEYRLGRRRSKRRWRLAWRAAGRHAGE